VVADLHDPFNVVVLSPETLSEDPARLPDEAGAISMMGGDRLIRIENATDKIAPLLKDYLEAPSDSALIVIEAGELSPRSLLRKLCESAKNAAAVPCYVEDTRDLARLIRESLNAENLSAEPDAVTWLAAHIAGDRQKARREIEKLIIYMIGAGATITLRDAQACCGTAGAQELDDLVYAVAGGDSARALNAYTLLMEDGVNFVVILRSLQNHFRRLHLARARCDQGESIDTVMKSLRPPVFFKLAPAFKSQCQGWSGAAFLQILQRLKDIEAQCKQTGAPVETLCAQAILGISAARKKRAA
jgi:DNA polymerase-3 subunit delta